MHKERQMAMDDLDGVIAAPDHHKVLFENDAVRILETTIRAGDVTPLHTHLRPTAMYVISGSQFVRRDENGQTLLDTAADPNFAMPRTMFSPGNPVHTLENSGPDDLIVIGVELKSPASI